MSWELEQQELDLDNARTWLKYLVENLWAVADGVVVGFLKNDEYYYLWMNNILRDDLREEYDTTRYIVKLIETRWLVKQLDAKILKKIKFTTHLYKIKTLLFLVFMPKSLWKTTSEWFV